MNKNIQKIAAVLATLVVLAGCGGPAAPGKYAAAAKCLTQKNVIMYGAYWCPHCAQQKKNFGDDFQFVHYQECDPKGPGGDKAACLEAGVSSYPTWKFPGQGNLVGEQQVRDLAKLANCTDQLPAEDIQKLKDDEAAAAADASKNPATPGAPDAATTAAPAATTSTTPATTATTTPTK